MNSSNTNQITGGLRAKLSRAAAALRAAKVGVHTSRGAKGGAGIRAAVIGAFAAVLIAPVQPARASVFNYGGAGTLHTVNAGILQLDSAQQVVSGMFNPVLGASSGALYSFFVLDQRTDYKPAGWRFINPLAPTTVTSDLQQLYTDGTNYSYSIGQQVTPNMAAYWMVNLPSAAAGYVPGTVNPLSQYDVLVIRVDSPSTVYMGLSRNERELLRDFVDQGGTLWIEDAGGADTLIKDQDASPTDTPAGLFVDVAFHTLAGAPGNAYVSDGDHRHPILTQPNFLTYPELNGISSDFDATTGAPDYPSYLSSQFSIDQAPDPAFLTTVIGNSAASGTVGAQPSIAAGDFGSGHVVIDDCNVLGGISEVVQPRNTDTYSARGQSAGYAPASLARAQPSDLQFAYNLISWSGGESTTDGADARHSGAQTSAEIGSSLLGSWTFPDTSYTTTPVVNGVGVAISGNIAYVTSVDHQGSGGTLLPTLRAFDIDPVEDLNQNNSSDDGDSVSASDPLTNIPYLQDFSAGLNYDELWATQLGHGSTNLSAPTIATLPVGTLGVNSTGYYNAVFVEDQSGSLYFFDATSNPASATPTYAGYIDTNSGSAFTGTVPSPVYSHGWLIAPQPSSGTMSHPMVYLVYLGGGSTNPPKFKEQLDGSSAATQDTTSIISAPAVAIVPSLDTKYGGSDIVAYLATQAAVYPQFLGSRDEEVSGAAATGFQTKLSSLQGTPSSNLSPVQGVTNLVGAPEDAFGTAGNKYCAYLSADPDWNYGLTGLEHVPNFRTGFFAPATLNLTIGLIGTNETGLTSAYADYDVVPGGLVTGNTTAPGTATLSRHQIQANVGGGIVGTTQVQVAGIAVGDDDTLYMTVNEAKGAYVEAVQEQNPELNSTSNNGTVIKWRYSIGQNSGYAPAPLNAATTTVPRFIGAPVVDRNHIYALAVDGSNAYVLCFNHDANFYLNVGAISEGSVTLQQVDENGMTQVIQPSQYNITDAQTGAINITNFSPVASSAYAIYPNLSASIPVTPNVGDASAQTSAISISSNSDGSSLLAWSAAVALNGAATPGALREFGNFLYFGNGSVTRTVSGVASTFAEISSLASDSGAVQTPTEVSSTASITAPMAASGSAVVGVGSNGIVGAAYNGTMVADSSRLIEYAPDGSPMWSLDSTTQQAAVYDTSATTTPTLATTNVSLSRPSSVTMLASNDILFADTGNNRCVRVDRGGNVLWELNSFNDPTGLLAPGQPLTLNDPTSVVEWRENDLRDARGNVVTIEHYLVSDAGNFRILEVDDIFTNGTIYKADPQEYHVLRWVSHTFDKAGRNYRYVYASRYIDNSTATPTVSILAGVANRQIAPLVVNGASRVLDTASRDSAGSSVVLLAYTPTPLPALNTNYTPAGSTTAVSAYQEQTYSATATGSFLASSNGLPYAVINQIIYGTNASPVTIPIRNLRYVDAYLPAGQLDQNNKPAESIVIADDDGVFDGIALGISNTASFSIVAIPQFVIGAKTLNNRIGFSFTQADYTGANLSSLSNNYAPKNAFTPTSAQRLDNGNYLITNGATTGDATPLVENATEPSDIANNLRHFGGDVIEVSGLNKSQVGTTFGRQSTSPKANSNGNVNTTAPLSLPAFAVRAQ